MYAVVDMKSFYASVECVERGLDPLTARLVVADLSRTEKTICLAVTPALKQYGLSGRSRLFEVTEKAREVLARTGEPLEYIVAPPRMRLYMAYSARIHEKVYLKYFAPEDVYPYSIDEVFLDLSRYRDLYGGDPRELVKRVILDIQAETGLIATGGVGTNLFLAKAAMDIVSKHEPPDADGVRIARLDERSFRERLWDHRPITDFWRIARGTARRLRRFGVETMGQLARLSLTQEDALFREFGVNAELFIDHAWGFEPCTLAEIRGYTARSSSLSVGQILPTPYGWEKGRLIVREMAEQLAMDLAAKGLTADGVHLWIGYDREAVDSGSWTGPTEPDFYGRLVPRPAGGTQAILTGRQRVHTDSVRRLTEAAVALFDRLAEPSLPLRRFSVAFLNTAPREARETAVQLDMFTSPEEAARQEEAEAREARLRDAMLRIRGKYGKNALLKAMNLQEGATAMQRNRMVGGHADGEDREEAPHGEV